MNDIKLPVKWLREKGVELELDDIWFSDHTLLNVLFG